MERAELASKYDASGVEAAWYEKWESAGLFQPESNSNKPLFTITIPPPNITGSLHMGHALCYPTQDMLARYRRLRGFNVLVLPGQDHAGIATQSVVAKQVRAEGLSPSDLGRDAFVERVWAWRQVSGDSILKQFRHLGCAFDWSRQRFTLDEQYARAVLKVFVEWFDKGLVYKGKRVVNWDPVLRTSVSDIETERELRNGKLYKIRYPFVDGSGGVVIATTRPETMLADVAVAVHPSDARHKASIGKLVHLPLTDRQIPVIADEYPDPEFGTGAVKITPAHDANDFEVGQRHELEMPVLLDEEAKITPEGGKYAGLDRFEARKRIVKDLEEQGHLVEVENHQISILLSERSKEPIEPLLSEQWFVRQTELAEPAIEAVRSGRIKFHPERYEKVYLDWMENIRDWCVSRQLWWGHRIPVYYDADGNAYAGETQEIAQSKAGDKPLIRQDEDVLDTWFSSGLWPFATLGWPEKTDDLATHYPTSVLVTDRNIIYLWVARMIMMGLDFMDEVPFHDVFVHATVLTEDGKRMSKSLGTGVDPMEAIESMGADALRYALLAQTGTNQEIRYSEKRVEEARNFCNKIWNASRFVLMNQDGFEVGDKGEQNDVDRWLLSRLAACEASVRESYDRYDFQSASQALYQFFWTEYCDWYIELSKDRLEDPARRAAPLWVLMQGLDAFLRMMHPIMPHLTEEIFSRLPSSTSGFLMQSQWPEIPSSWRCEDLEAKVDRWLEVTRALRALRAEVGLPAMKQIDLALYEGDLGEGESVVASQAWIGELRKGRPESKKVVATRVEGIDLYLPFEGLIDESKEVQRLQADRERLQKELQTATKMLDNPKFVERAKPEVVQKQRDAVEELNGKISKVEERLKVFGAA